MHVPVSTRWLLATDLAQSIHASPPTSSPPPSPPPPRSRSRTRRLSPAVSSSGDEQGGVQGPRKTSHKAAEQKWRDSLKALFDELRPRMEPLRPGSMPPYRPPNGDADGPNRYPGAGAPNTLVRAMSDYDLVHVRPYYIHVKAMAFPGLFWWPVWAVPVSCDQT